MKDLPTCPMCEESVQTDDKTAVRDVMCAVFHKECWEKFRVEYEAILEPKKES